MATKRPKSERSRARKHRDTVNRRKAELAEARDYYVGSVVSTEGGFTPAFATASHGLKPHTQRRAIALSDKLDQQNPIYRAAVDITASFVHGDGFTVTGRHDAVNDLIAEAWELNCFDDELFEMIRSGEKYGEQFFPAFVGMDDLVQLGVVHPKGVKDVVPESRTNAREAVKVLVAPERAGGDPEEYEVIRRDRKASEDRNLWVFDPVGQGEDGADGFFYLPLNRAQGSVRGMPSFISGFGYFEQAADALWTGLERLRLHNRFAYDVEVQGTDEQAQKVEDDIIASGPPRPLSVNVHTHNVKWTSMVPQIGATEFETVFKVTLQMLSNATGIPPHILASPHDVNRATAAEMGEPFLRIQERKQARWVAFLRQFFGFQIWYAKYHGSRLRNVSDEDLGFEVQASPIRPTDKAQEIEEMRGMSELALLNRRGGFWTREESARIVRAHAEHLGVDQEDELPEELLVEPEPQPAVDVNRFRELVAGRRQARDQVAQEAA